MRAILDKADVEPEHNEKKTLVIIFHGAWAKPSKFKAMREDCLTQNCDVYIPALPYGRRLSFVSFPKIIARVNKEIDALVRRENYESIIMIGHSLGAQLVRGLYAAAWEETAGSTEARPDFKMRPDFAWTSKVTRLIYVAGLHRGWTVDSYVKRGHQAVVYVADRVAGAMKTLGLPLPSVFEAKRGSQALISLRLKVIKLNQFLQRQSLVIDPVTIQVLGTRDDFVTPVSQVDASPNSQIYYVEVPGSGHKDIVHTPSYYKGRWFVGNQKAHAERRKVILGTIINMPAKNFKNRLGDDIFTTNDFDFSPPVDDVTDLVFIIHGIRDKAYWTPKLARNIKARAKSQHGDRKVETATPTYGYFPIIDFVFPFLRRSKVAWLADQYVMYKSKYPKAKFHYIGHSNGTQIFSEAITAHEGMIFENVVFAGSVVRKHFNWKKYLGRNITRLRNYVATGDAVVAIFPKGLQWIPYFNLGSAGHDGFKTIHADLRNVRYISGGHGAAITDDMWDEISTFILDGQSGEAEEPIKQERQSWKVRVLGMVSAGLVLSMLAGVIALLSYLLTSILNRAAPDPHREFYAIWSDRSAIYDAGRALICDTVALPLLGLIVVVSALRWVGKKF